MSISIDSCLGKQSVRAFLFLPLLLAMTVGILANEHWPRFRGSSGRSVEGDDPRLPSVWGKDTNRVWTATVPGMGWSSPIIWGERVFVTSVINDEEFERPKAGLYLGRGIREPQKGLHHWLVSCLSLKSGELLWSKEVYQGNPRVPRHPKSTYASETPTTDGQRVYALFGDVGLYALTMDGEIDWKVEIQPKETFYDYGAAGSPIVHDGQVIVVYDNQEYSYITSFDAETGTRNWLTERKEKSTWATPYVWEHSLGLEIVTSGKERIRSYSLEGKLLWEYEGQMSNLIIPSPFAVDDLLYVTSGYVGDQRRPVHAIRPGGKGDITPDEEDLSASEYVAWWQPKAGPYNTSPIVYKGLYYTLYDRGLWSVHEAKSGALITDRERFPGLATFTASPWAYNDRLFCLSEQGTTYVIEAGGEFKIERMNELEELCLASPAYAQGKLLVRTVSQIYCFSSLPEAL